MQLETTVLRLGIVVVPLMQPDVVRPASLHSSVLARQVGMEMWARYAHKALWHDFEPGWRLHKSHHVPRLGAFEDNDVFAIINAVPAMGLCAYGFLTPNVVGGAPLCHSRNGRGRGRDVMTLRATQESVWSRNPRRGALSVLLAA